MRIYIGNTEIAGYFTRLKDGFDQEGIKADLWFLSSNKFYKDQMGPIVKLNQILFRWYKETSGLKGKLLKYLLLPFVVMLKIAILCFVIFRYDVFILNSHAYFNFYELGVIKFFKKKIIFVCLGTESRPLYMSGNFIMSRYVQNGQWLYEKCYKEVEKQKQQMERIEKYADVVINHPPTALFHAKPFVSWLNIGFPCGQMMTNSLMREERSRIVKILHAPSNAVSKGSIEIEAMVGKLKSQGYPVEFIKLQNVPNEKVIEIIKDCDIVVDELYSDIPLGGLGTEASVAGKPVLSAGYYANCIYKEHSEDIIPPSLFCHPDYLESELIQLVTDRGKRLEYGAMNASFVKKNWNNRAVAQKYLLLIKGEVPSKWYFHPENIKCVHGYGMQEDRLKRFIQGYIDAMGEDALFLNHNPAVKLKLKGFLQQNRLALHERPVS